MNCRTSGVLSNDAVISINPCRLVSIHVTCRANAADEYILKIYDSKDNDFTGNTEIARLVFNGNTQAQNVEFDMHGVLCSEGLYADVTAPASPDAESHFAFSVEFN